MVGFLNLCTIQGVVDKLHVPFKHKTFTRCDVIKFWGNIWDLIAPYSTNRNGMLMLLGNSTERNGMIEGAG